MKKKSKVSLAEWTAFLMAVAAVLTALTNMIAQF